MAKGFEVLAMLCPEKEWIITGNDYDGIVWIKGEPISKEEFEAGFAQYDAWKAEQDKAKAAEKAALLDRLGISETEAKLLLS